uniref:(California timema) hypothetical protein n=1 Tax=Timema californicum TaxID=61474 RepID=A0A7R9JDS0_TIMCA|nr:unnamed protein product [Timema californicum]
MVWIRDGVSGEYEGSEGAYFKAAPEADFPRGRLTMDYDVTNKDSPDRLVDSFHSDCARVETLALECLREQPMPILSTLRTLSKGDCAQLLQYYFVKQHTNVEQATMLSLLTDYVTCAHRGPDWFYTFHRKTDRYGAGSLFMNLSSCWYSFFCCCTPQGRHIHVCDQVAAHQDATFTFVTKSLSLGHNVINLSGDGHNCDLVAAHQDATFTFVTKSLSLGHNVINLSGDGHNCDLVAAHLDATFMFVTKPLSLGHNVINLSGHDHNCDLVAAHQDATFMFVTKSLSLGHNGMAIVVTKSLSLGHNVINLSGDGHSCDQVAVARLWLLSTVTLMYNKALHTGDCQQWIEAIFRLKSCIFPDMTEDQLAGALSSLTRSVSRLLDVSHRLTFKGALEAGQARLRLFKQQQNLPQAQEMFASGHTPISVLKENVSKENWVGLCNVEVKSGNQEQVVQPALVTVKTSLSPLPHRMKKTKKYTCDITKYIVKPSEIMIIYIKSDSCRSHDLMYEYVKVDLVTF